MSAMNSLRQALSGWEPDDIEWLAQEIASGNIVPPQPCVGCQTPTTNIDDAYGPLCDDCDQARAEAASDNDGDPGIDDGEGDDEEDEP